MVPKALRPHPDAADTAAVLARLRGMADPSRISGLERYGIVARHALGIPVGDLRTLARKLGRNQALSLSLWDTGIYEARLLAAFVGEPREVTRRQMDAWARSFENWAECDTACFSLFDRSEFAWAHARVWARRSKEFVKRAGFALMAALAQHDKKAADERFEPFLAVIEAEAGDDRNFVKKGASWALRGIGQRSPALRARALAIARRLAASPSLAYRFVGRDAIRELERPAVSRRKAKRAGGR